VRSDKPFNGMTMITQPYSRRHWTVFTRQLANNHGDKHTGDQTQYLVNLST